LTSADPNIRVSAGSIRAETRRDLPIFVFGAGFNINTVHFPFAILRLGGGVFSDLPASSGAALARIRQMASLQDALAEHASGLTDALTLLLPRAYEIDSRFGKALLQIKRDVHNYRAIISDRLDGIKCLAPSSLIVDLHRFATKVAELVLISDQLDSVYYCELEAHQRAVMRLATHPNISTAIEITNPKFAAALANLKSCAQIGSDRKSSQCATTLLRYGLRAIQKTSPLSSLGLVGLVEPARDTATCAGGKIDVSGPLRRSKQVQFRVLEQLREQLCADPGLLSDLAPIRLNRNLSAQDNEWLWAYPKPRMDARVAVSGTRLVEARSKSGFVRLMVQLLANGGQLAQAELRASAIVAAPQVAENYDAFLQQAWLSKVIELAVPDSLNEFEQIRFAIEAQSGDRQSRLRPLLDACQAALQHESSHTIFPPALHALQAATDLPEGPLISPLVDDCMFDTSGTTGIGAVFPGPVAQFATLVRLIPLLTSAEPMRAIERWLTARLIAEVGEGGTVSAAADFVAGSALALEVFLRQGPQIDSTQDSFFERLGIARDPAIVSTLDLLLHTLLSRACDGATTLSCEEANELVDAVPSASVPARLSKLIYYHPVREDNGGMTFVINSIYPGYASMFSRFITANSHELNAARDYLRASAPRGGFAELGGHFGFNANHHPQIAARTVAMPPFHYGEKAAINLAELAIAHNPQTNALEFIDAAGNAIDLHFFGVIQPFMLPLSYLVIQAVSQSVVRVPKLDLMLIERGTVNSHGVIIAPRVKLDDLIISRLCIAVPFQTLPDPTLTDCVFFRQFNEWADETDLPERMFYRFAAVTAFQAEGTSPSSVSPTPRQDKPMPLDRAAPALVRLFQKDLKSNGLDVLFSEALPDFGQSVFVRDGEPIIGELGLELTVSSRS
jgi:hypothetical protein